MHHTEFCYDIDGRCGGGGSPGSGRGGGGLSSGSPITHLHGVSYYSER